MPREKAQPCLALESAAVLGVVQKASGRWGLPQVVPLRLVHPCATPLVHPCAGPLAHPRAAL